MPTRKDIAVLVGSLRRESFSRKTARALQALAPASLKLEIVEIGDLAIYNEDVEAAGAPAPGPVSSARSRPPMAALRDAGIQPIGPGLPEERDRRRLAALWVGRLGRKARRVVSVSPGAWAGSAPITTCASPCLPQRADDAAAGGIYLRAATLFDASGALTSQTAREFLASSSKHLPGGWNSTAGGDHVHGIGDWDSGFGTGVLGIGNFCPRQRSCDPVYCGGRCV